MDLEGLCGIDVRECMAKEIVENVVDLRAPVKLFGGYVNVRTLDGRNKVAGEPSHELEVECALLCKKTTLGRKDEPDQCRCKWPHR